jgi:hypothetical protein
MSVEAGFDGLWELPFKSQEFRHGPVVTQSPSQVELAMDHETDTGDYVWTALVFHQVRAFSFVAHPMCSPEQVDAYDRVVSVSRSRWLKTFHGPMSPEVTHYRIYFDEFGCYDIAAAHFEVRDAISAPPERRH